MKKKILCALLAAVCLSSVFFAGVCAGGGLQEVTAYLNYGLSVALNGKVQELKDANGNTVIPITYNDSTYLPVRAISNILGHQVSWDEASQCVLLDGSEVPFELRTVASTQVGDIVVPDPSAGQMDLSFLNTVMQRYGNGKLIFGEYEIENFTVDGIWQGNKYESVERVAYSYYWMAIETKDYYNQPAEEEIVACEKAICEALVSNGYALIKTDEYGYKHYVKGINEFMIKNYENREIKIEPETNWLSCCAART